MPPTGNGTGRGRWPADRPSALERFRSKTRRHGACIEWTAGVRSKKDPYGAFWINGHTVPAHVWIFEQTTGIAADVVMHTCDNPRCVNPKHLKAGTVDDNNKDRAIKKRSAIGEDSGRAKLTDEQVQSLRRRYKLGGISQAAIAQKFGICERQAWMIINHRSRKLRARSKPWNE